MPGLFADRRDAGRQLAAALRSRVGLAPAVVLALPRGGVPVGAEVARTLDVPLDVLIVRKLGVPGQEELAMGAIASGGVRVLNEDVVRHLVVTAQTIEAVAARENAELERREHLYRAGRPRQAVAGKAVILVDDGLATGSTMEAAVRAVRKLEPALVAVAVPVAPVDTVARLRRIADDVVCLRTPEPFFSIGQWYADFAQVSDETVQALLAQAPVQGADLN